MGKFFEEIPGFLISWIQQQHMFWVATAPLSKDGHVNVSPKGFEGSFNVVNSRKVWYEDFSGSGVETISHLKENGRITILFHAFEGPPRIARLFGTGTIYEFGSKEYDELLPFEKRSPGSRAVIMVDVHKVGTSCGYSIPFYDFKCHRMKLHQMAAEKENADVNVEAMCTDLVEPPWPEKGLKGYWKDHNTKSIDGLPGLSSAHKSTIRFKKWEEKFQPDDTVSKTGVKLENPKASSSMFDASALMDKKTLLGFSLGVLASMLVVKVRMGAL